MTMSMNNFMGNLLRSKNGSNSSSDSAITDGGAGAGIGAGNGGGSGCSRFVIIDDNAQLSRENRLKNSKSFASRSHQLSRWSSQPILTRRASTASLPKSTRKEQRRSSLTEMPTPRSGISNNATWENARDVAIAFERQDRLSTTSHSSSTSLSNQAGATTSSRHSSRKLSTSVSQPIIRSTTPRLPERMASPHHRRPNTVNVKSSRLPRNLDNKDSIQRSSSTANESRMSAQLRNALGSMAPTGSNKNSNSNSNSNSNRNHKSIDSSLKKKSADRKSLDTTKLSDNALARIRES